MTSTDLKECRKAMAKWWRNNVDGTDIVHHPSRLASAAFEAAWELSMNGRPTAAPDDVETAWLIEFSQSVSKTPLYWGYAPNNEDGPLGMTHDHLEALRFARKWDAERVIEYHGWTDAGAVEHQWHPAPEVAIASRNLRDWPDDYASGENKYECECGKCHQAFYGHKGRMICKACRFPTDASDEKLAKLAGNLEAARAAIRAFIGGKEC